MKDMKDMNEETEFRMVHDPENNTFGFGPLIKPTSEADESAKVIEAAMFAAMLEEPADPNFIYEIDLDRVPTPLALLNWIHHLSEKYWITTMHVHDLIDEICRIKGWDHHGSN